MPVWPNNQIIIHWQSFTLTPFYPLASWLTSWPACTRNIGKTSILEFSSPRNGSRHWSCAGLAPLAPICLVLSKQRAREGERERKGREELSIQVAHCIAIHHLQQFNLLPDNCLSPRPEHEDNEVTDKTTNNISTYPYLITLHPSFLTLAYHQMHPTTIISRRKSFNHFATNFHPFGICAADNYRRQPIGCRHHHHRRLNARSCYLQ